MPKLKKGYDNHSSNNNSTIGDSDPREDIGMSYIIELS